MPDVTDALPEGQPAAWWDAFYGNRAKPCPFFCADPDESLAGLVVAGILGPGRALDVGCGNGRNAVYLARQGFLVDAIDLSSQAATWAAQSAAEAGVTVNVRCASVFDADLKPGGYDLIYDSGCFHHLPPHRRASYVEILAQALRPGGWFGLTCFTPEGGSGYTDAEVYARGSLGGGLGYTSEQLEVIWSQHLRVQTLRPMRQMPVGSGRFGQGFLWAMLARKP